MIPEDQKIKLHNDVVQSDSFIPSPLDSILLAVLTVSPNRQYLGMVLPTTPAKIHQLVESQN